VPPNPMNISSPLKRSCCCRKLTPRWPVGGGWASPTRSSPAGQRVHHAGGRRQLWDRGYPGVGDGDLRCGRDRCVEAGRCQEVRNYILALRHGLKRLEEGFPVSLRLIKEMHELLLDKVRGQERNPGEFRRSQNWISSPGNQPVTARFVPPAIDHMWHALDDWEKYAHQEKPRLPLLVRCALLYYQFETIHPFLDGNGRLGRPFIILCLVDRRRLPAPLLYLSNYFDRRKDEYYDRLQYVRERGEVDSCSTSS